MSGWTMIGRKRTKVRHIRRMVVKMMIALFISERSRGEPAATAIGAKTVGMNVNPAIQPSSFVAARWQQAPKTMVMARLMGMIAK